MPTVSPVTLLAERLPKGLVHPGNGQDQAAKLLPLPGLSSAGIPPLMAEQFAKEAGFPTSDVPQLLAEAIIHLLEDEGGYTLIPTTDLEQLQTEATAPDTSSPTVQVYCRCNPAEPILTVATGRQKVTMHAPDLAARITQVCTCPTSQ